MNHRRFVRSAFALALLAALVSAPLAVHAWDLAGPASGRWSVALFQHDWAGGEAIFCRNLAPTSSCGSSNLSGMDWSGPGDANDELSSYQICNNTGEALEFHTSMYLHAGSVGVFDERYFLVEDGECVIHNLAIDDVLSSFSVRPQ